VFNDDHLVPGAIWPLHPHRDIEGLTYVVEGTFRHADDLGGDYQLLPAGSAQRMTLGSGAWHSEQNGSETEPMRFIQMWIIPRERGLPPSVEQKNFAKEDRTDRWLRIISGEDEGSVLVHQDAHVYVSSLTAGTRLAHEFGPGTGGYLYLISGGASLNDEKLTTGDAAKVWDEDRIAVEAQEPSELIMVEVRLDRS
jgi:redox-sensitive bicupin YhaK (pirin superfamily)